MARILLIDDQEPVRTLLRAVLERAGHDVYEASNGRDGLARYTDFLPNLVITVPNEANTNQRRKQFSKRKGRQTSWISIEHKSKRGAAPDTSQIPWLHKNGGSSCSN